MHEQWCRTCRCYKFAVDDDVLNVAIHILLHPRRTRGYPTAKCRELHGIRLVTQSDTTTTQLFGQHRACRPTRHGHNACTGATAPRHTPIAPASTHASILSLSTHFTRAMRRMLTVAMHRVSSLGHVTPPVTLGKHTHNNR
mgnify:CR=1 FL=1